MLGKVWILPLYTVMVAISNASSGQSCTCGGPTENSSLTGSIDVLSCGPTDGPTDCDGKVCVCDYGVTIDVDMGDFLFNGAAEPYISWYCDHNGGDGYCTNCTPDGNDCTGEKPYCCPETGLCSTDPADGAGACGDPHMTGFLGQKFDFVGQDGEWYAVVSDMPDLEVNM
ncbi:unnamed protein product, partial [Ectocarpus sp. 12 AP-2014]